MMKGTVKELGSMKGGSKDTSGQDMSLTRKDKKAKEMKSDKIEWESHYENIVPSVDFERFAHPNWEQPYLRRLKSFSEFSKTSLEFGSGKGGLSLSLKRLSPGIETFLMDYSLAALKFSKSLHEYYNISANFINGSFLNFPFKANTFDLIHGNTVLEHVLDTDQALRELSRVLRGGGVFDSNSA